MKWIKFTVYTSDIGLELLSGIFTMPGLNGYTVFESKEKLQAELEDSAKYWDYADMDKIAPYDEPSICTLYADLHENDHITSDLEAAIALFAKENPDFDLGSLRTTIETVEDEDWANNWKQYYKPFEIGNRLLICPSWESVPENCGERVVLTIDPGMAFGTGTHETTSMCLCAVEDYVTAGCNVLDLGCGSGILAIASGLLGANKLVCVDVDPACIKVTKENAQINNQDISTFIGDVALNDVREAVIDANGGNSFDIVFANIVAGILIPLAPHIPKLLSRGGYFISSGIIADRLDEVCAAYENSGLCIEKITRQGEWCACIAKIK